MDHIIDFIAKKLGLKSVDVRNLILELQLEDEYRFYDIGEIELVKMVLKKSL